MMPILKAATNAPTNMRKIVPGPRIVPTDGKKNCFQSEKIHLYNFIYTLTHKHDLVKHVKR